MHTCQRRTVATFECSRQKQLSTNDLLSNLSVTVMSQASEFSASCVSCTYNRYRREVPLLYTDTCNSNIIRIIHATVACTAFDSQGMRDIITSVAYLFQSCQCLLLLSSSHLLRNLPLPVLSVPFVVKQQPSLAQLTSSSLVSPSCC